MLILYCEFCIIYYSRQKKERKSWTLRGCDELKVAVIALTNNGVRQALKVGCELQDRCGLQTDIYVKDDIYANVDIISKYIINEQMVLVHPFATSFKKLIEKIFYAYDGLIFIMACGIVVRSIAPYLTDKTKDPAVVVLDEMGRYAISLLSGHIGGANKLAAEVADITGGIPIITTATDINNVIAFDMFAKENDCVIENIEYLKYVSSELVNGGKVHFYTDCNLSGIFPKNIILYKPDKVTYYKSYKSDGVYSKEYCSEEHRREEYRGKACKIAVILSNRADVSINAEKVLYLRPKNLIIGIGCKKGKSKKEIEDAVTHFLNKNKRSILSVRCMASITLKAEEKGIADFCNEKNIEFLTFSVDEIKTIEKNFNISEFVNKVTGVGNVAETCAVLAGKKVDLIVGKTVYNGITLSLAEEKKVLYV